jgi:hypothetical protein
MRAQGSVCLPAAGTAVPHIGSTYVVGSVVQPVVGAPVLHLRSAGESPGRTHYKDRGCRRGEDEDSYRKELLPDTSPIAGWRQSENEGRRPPLRHLILGKIAELMTREALALFDGYTVKMAPGPPGGAKSVCAAPGLARMFHTGATARC